MKNLLLIILTLASSLVGAASHVAMEQYERGHWGINVVINSSVSYPFIIDTGAQGAIIPSQLIDELGLNVKDLPEMRIRGAVGEKTVKQLTIPAMTIGDQTATNIHGIITDLPMKSPSGKVPGVLPYTVLNQFIPEFDLINQRLTLYDKSGEFLSTKSEDFLKVPITLVHGSFISFPLNLNGIPIHATLDSGAAKRIDINWQAANLLKIDKTDSALTQGTSIRGAGGQTLDTVQYPDVALALNDLSLGSRAITISDMPILSVLHGDKPAANVGIGLFENKKVIIDYQNKALLVSII